jgi:hypothetical protein
MTNALAYFTLSERFENYTQLKILVHENVLAYSAPLRNFLILDSS